MAVAAPPVSHDFNADGSNDYPVSVTGYDAADPVDGAARMWSGASKAIIDTIVGDETNTLFGWSIGSAGDLDGDGFDGLIVGEPLWGSGTLQGRVRVFSGDDSSTLLTVNGPYLETGLGRYVTGIGDWDGDGTPDLVSSGWDIADLDEDGVGDDAIGIVFVLSGADGSILAEIIEPTATELFGYSVFGLGDVTGDGLADIAVVDRGAPGAAGSGAAGVLYVFAGRAQPSTLSAADAHRTIANADPTIRGFAAQVDTMHPDLWLDEATLQIISLTSGGAGGPNEAETVINVRKVDGQFVGTKGVRPTLVLAGDVNLDGKVDALDLQESIAQLGTNPQAIGVMPLADLNEDNVVDTHDVALLLQSYGEETDIYEGLWDGSRLLSVVGGHAGFGAIAPGGPIGGTLGPGRRPKDDCLRDMPENNGPGMLPRLLRRDGRTNCDQCIPCNAPDPNGCYECGDNGRITGGEITVTPEQPKPGDTAVFTWTEFRREGRTKKCKETCGGDSDDECPLSDSSFGLGSWVLEKKDPDTGDWVQIDSGSNTNTVSVTGEACSEYRLRLTSAPAPGITGCEDQDVEPVEKEKEVQFAGFTLIVKARAEWPDQNRSQFGPSEVAEIHVDPLSAGLTWDASFTPADAGLLPAPASGVWLLLPPDVGSYTVSARSGDCVRRVRLEVIPPSGLELTLEDSYNVASSPCGNAVQVLALKLLPDTVNFSGIQVREGTSTPAQATGAFDHLHGRIHSPLADWSNVKAEENELELRDFSGKVARPDSDGTFRPGTFSWTINVHWKPKGAYIPNPPKFTAVTMSATVDDEGRVCVEKHGVGPTCKAFGSGGNDVPQFIVDMVNGQCGD